MWHSLGSSRQEPVVANQNNGNRPKELRRVWGIFYFVGLMLLALVLLIPFLAIYDYWRAINRGELRPEGIEWQLVLSIAGVFLLGSCFALFDVWAELKVEFTKLGLSRRGYFGYKFIQWGDINEVKVVGQYVILKTAKQAIKLNTLYYKDRAAFFQLILDSVPKLATWYMPKKSWAALKKNRLG